MQLNSLCREHKFKKMKRLLFALIALILSMSNLSAAEKLTPKESEAYKFADKLIKKMTLREKIGQLQQFVPKKRGSYRPWWWS